MKFPLKLILSADDRIKQYFNLKSFLNEKTGDHRLSAYDHESVYFLMNEGTKCWGVAFQGTLGAGDETFQQHDLQYWQSNSEPKKIVEYQFIPKQQDWDELVQQQAPKESSQTLIEVCLFAGQFRTFFF